MCVFYNWRYEICVDFSRNIWSQHDERDVSLSEAASLAGAAAGQLGNAARDSMKKNTHDTPLDEIEDSPPQRMDVACSFPLTRTFGKIPGGETSHFVGDTRRKVVEFCLFKVPTCSMFAWFRIRVPLGVPLDLKWKRNPT